MTKSLILSRLGWGSEGRQKFIDSILAGSGLGGAASIACEAGGVREIEVEGKAIDRTKSAVAARAPVDKYPPVPKEESLPAKALSQASSSSSAQLPPGKGTAAQLPVAKQAPLPPNKPLRVPLPPQSRMIEVDLNDDTSDFEDHKPRQSATRKPAVKAEPAKGNFVPPLTKKQVLFVDTPGSQPRTSDNIGASSGSQASTSGYIPTPPCSVPKKSADIGASTVVGGSQPNVSPQTSATAKHPAEATNVIRQGLGLQDQANFIALLENKKLDKLKTLSRQVSPATFRIYEQVRDLEKQYIEELTALSQRKQLVSFEDHPELCHANADRKGFDKELQQSRRKIAAAFGKKMYVDASGRTQDDLLLKHGRALLKVDATQVFQLLSSQTTIRKAVERALIEDTPTLASGSQPRDSQASAALPKKHIRYKDILSRLGFVDCVENSSGRKPPVHVGEKESTAAEDAYDAEDWANWWMRIGGFEAS
jgi:hypothetical protein